MCRVWWCNHLTYSFERLKKKYEPLIFKTVHTYFHRYKRHLGGDIDHDELEQIAVIALWQANLRFNLSEVGMDREPEAVFIAYAASTIRGNVSDYLRKLSKRGNYETLTQSDLPLEIPDTSPNDSIQDQMLAYLKEYRSLLSPRENQYLELSIIKGWTTKQIAEFTNVSENTVRSWKKSLCKKFKPLRVQVLKG
nr:sigma-70 family RNA polymerase sigma factor [Sporolactobacillus kofuensis]